MSKVDTVQTAAVVDVSVTVNDDEALGASVNGVADQARSAGSAKAIVWAACEISRLCVTETAAE
jgi:hypothetical protein